MTVKELIRELQDVPKNAIVLCNSRLYQCNCIAGGVMYNNAINTISFYDGDIFEESDNSNDINKNIDPMASQENKDDNKRTRFILDSDGDTYHVMLTKEQVDFMDWCFKNCIDFSRAGAEEIKDVNWEMP